MTSHQNGTLDRALSQCAPCAKLVGLSSGSAGALCASEAAMTLISINNSKHSIELSMQSISQDAYARFGWKITL